MAHSDIPQATLDRIVGVVRALGARALSVGALQEDLGASRRHVNYGLSAAKALDLIIERSGEFSLTRLGRDLTASQPGSDDEASVLISAISRSPILAQIAPGLLSDQPPTVASISAAIQQQSNLGRGTADHRAAMILAWRRALLSTRSLPFGSVPKDSNVRVAAKRRAAAAPLALGDSPDALVETVQFVGGNLGPIPACNLKIYPFTVLVGPQGSGKSLLAQVLYFFRALPELIPVVVAALPRSEKFSIEGVVRYILDGLRSQQRAFAGFAEKSVTVRWSEAPGTSPTLGFGAYSWNRRIRPDKHLESYVSKYLRQSSAANRGIFIPTERLFYSQVRSPLAAQVLSLPNTYAWFSEWMQRATDVFEGWSRGAPDTPRGRWVRERARAALAGEAYRFQSTWKWRFPKGDKETGILDLDMASSGQRATWPIVLLAEALFTMRKRARLDKSFALYVEEPEIHLHPSAQVAVVEILAYLVNNGFRVLVTTHSLTVLYALNNLIMAGRLGKKRPAGVPPEVAWLDPSKVGAYSLSCGNQPKNLVDRQTGFISEAELGLVSEELNSTMNVISSYLESAPPAEME